MRIKWCACGHSERWHDDKGCFATGKYDEAQAVFETCQCQQFRESE